MKERSIPFIDLKAQYGLLKAAIDDAIQTVLDHGQYIMGPEVSELEFSLADFVNVDHAIGVSDGTTALLIALMAIDIKPGDEVITTPFTFWATGEMIALLGAVPIFVDIDPHDFNIDCSQIEQAITRKTRAIMPVSLYGQCADMDAINTIADAANLVVIEDAAQSFGATYRGRRSGGLSTIGCTSFFPSKPLGCYGDGGACFTNDSDLADRMKKIRLHGQEARYKHSMIGLNGRLDTIQAAILLAKLPHFANEIERRQQIAVRYDQLLRDRNLTPPAIQSYNTSVYAQYTVRVPNRDLVAAQMKQDGIPTAVHYPVPLNRQPAFQSLVVRHALPHSEAAAESVLSLPMSPFLSSDDQDRVVDSLVHAIRRNQ